MSDHLTHLADGFGLKFTSRRSWEAARSYRGKVIDIETITWKRDYGTRNGKFCQTVYFQDLYELEMMIFGKEPFVIALADAKDYSVSPLSFGKFIGVFEVRSTGKTLGPHSIETEIIKRVRAEITWSAPVKKEIFVPAEEHFYHAHD